MPRRERWLVKAEKWLAAQAGKIDPCSNGEAIVYFLSRGGRLATPYDGKGKDIAARWHELQGHYSRSVARGRLVGLHPLTSQDCEPSPGFWGMDEDKAALLSLDATVMRVVQWASVSGFDDTLRAVGQHVVWEAGMADPSSESPAYRLFTLCRSDLAMKMWPDSLRALFQAALRGKPEPGRSWELRLFHPDEPVEAGYKGEIVGSVAVATALAFAELRGASNSSTAIQRIPKFLVDRQSDSGAWPGIGRSLDDVDSVLHTAMAIHVLSLTTPKPRGASNGLIRAVEWLRDQQLRDGSWCQDGVDPVYLTVLVLDSIELATGGEKLTFTLTEPASIAVAKPKKKAGRKRSVPESAYGEIQKAYANATTTGTKKEVIVINAHRFNASEDTIGRIARKNPPYNK